MGTTEEITILIKYSPKQGNILGSTKEKIECENDSDFHANNLLMQSVVLWNVWKHCSQNDQMKTELKSRIIGVKTEMESFHLFFGLNLGQRISYHTNNLFKILQAKKISACSSKRLAELTIQILQNMRNKLSFNSFYDNVAKNPRKRKLPNYSTIHLVDGTTSEAQGFHPTTCQDRY